MYNEDVVCKFRSVEDKVRSVSDFDDDITELPSTTESVLSVN